MEIMLGIKKILIVFLITRCAVFLAKLFNVFEIPFVHLYNGYSNGKSNNNNKKTLISEKL